MRLGHFKTLVEGTWLFSLLLPVSLELEEDTTQQSGKLDFAKPRETSTCALQIHTRSSKP